MFLFKLQYQNIKIPLLFLLFLYCTICNSQSSTTREYSPPVSLLFPNTTGSPIVEVKDGSIENFIWIAKATQPSVLSVALDSSMEAELQGPVAFNISTSWTNFNVTIKGDLIGKTSIVFSARYNETNVSLPERVSVHVLRSDSGTKLDGIFTYIIAVATVVTNVGVGLATDIRVVVKVLKRPVGPVIGFFCQFGIMPLLAFGALSAAGLEGVAAYGLFVAGSVPGGGNSNTFCILLNGDVPLSITMTTISIFASLGMLPLWLYTLGKYILKTNTSYSSISVPFGNIAISLALSTVPAAIGIIIRYKKEAAVLKFYKFYKVALFVILLFTFGMGIYSNFYVFSYLTGEIMGASIALPYGGFLIGMGIAAMCQQPWKRVFTIGIETGLQNANLAYLVVKLSMDAPDSDLAIITPTMVILLQFFTLWIVVIIHKIWFFCCYAKGRCLALDCKTGEETVTHDVKVPVEPDGRQVSYKNFALDYGSSNQTEGEWAPKEYK